jgi:hypothetical protein
LKSTLGALLLISRMMLIITNKKYIINNKLCEDLREKLTSHNCNQIGQMTESWTPVVSSFFPLNLWAQWIGEEFAHQHLRYLIARWHGFQDFWKKGTLYLKQIAW